jgi:hypothetical protein
MKTTSVPLLPLLRSRLQGELLAVLYLHPQTEYSLSELARTLDSSPRMIHYEATRLLGGGFILDRRIGNVRLLRANDTSPMFRPLSELLALTFGPLPVLSELLADVDGITEAYIYGSWAARYLGEPGAVPADVDVLVVGDANRSELDDCAQRAEVVLRRPVNIRRISQASWDESPPTNGFLTSVKTRPLVPLGVELTNDFRTAVE